MELSIERIIPLLFKEKKKHKERKKVLAKMHDLLAEGDDILRTVKSSLDEDDPVYRRIITMMQSVKNCCSDVEACVERGRKIEEF